MLTIKPIKVIFISALDIWSLGENKGAPSFYNTLNIYIKQRNEVVLIKPTGKYHIASTIDGLKIVSFRNDFLERFCKIRIVSFFARILSAKHLERSFYRLAKKEIGSSDKPCLLYAYEVHAVAAAKRASKKFHVPFVSRFQGTVLDGVEATVVNRLKNYPHFGALSQESDLVIMTNDGTRGNRVLETLNNKTAEQYFWQNGINMSDVSKDPQCFDRAKTIRSKFGVGEQDFLLMTLSRLAGWKRIDRAIEAMKILSQRDANIKLLIVGDGDCREPLEALVAKYSLEHSVKFAGEIEQKDSGYYYLAANAFLSLYDLSNVGNPLLEAMGYGLPIVTLDIGDTASIINDRVNGRLLPKDRPDLIADAVMEIKNDGDFRKSISKGAKDYVAQKCWSWETRMETEYNTVMKMVMNYYNITL